MWIWPTCLNETCCMRDLTSYFCWFSKIGLQPLLLPKIHNQVVLLNLFFALFCSGTTQGPKDLGGHDSHLWIFLPSMSCVATMKRQKYLQMTIRWLPGCINLAKTQPCMCKSVETEMWWPKTNFQTNDIKLNTLKYKRSSFQRAGSLELDLS